MGRPTGAKGPVSCIGDAPGGGAGERSSHHHRGRVPRSAHHTHLHAPRLRPGGALRLCGTHPRGGRRRGRRRGRRERSLRTSPAGESQRRQTPRLEFQAATTIYILQVCRDVRGLLSSVTSECTRTGVVKTCFGMEFRRVYSKRRMCQMGMA